MSAVYLQQFPSYSNHNCQKSSFLHTPAFIFCWPWGRPCGNHAKRCMNEKTIKCLPNPSQHVPIYLQQFPSYSNRKCKKSPFLRTATYIFVSPWRRPCDYHAICCMDGKTIQCLPNPSMHVPIYLQQFPSYTMVKSMRKSKNRYFHHIFVFSGDAAGAITLNVVWMEREFDAYKLSRCMCRSNYYRFWDTARYLWKKSSFYHTPLAFDAPVRGVPVGISAPPLGWKN